MIFEKYINLIDLCQLIIDDKERINIFLQKNKNYKHYVDNDMDSLRKKYFYVYDNNSYLKMIEKASAYNYTKNNELINLNINYPVKIISYSSTQDNYHIYYIKIGDEDTYRQFEMFGIIDDTTNKYIFIGLDEHHPFIYANEFEYHQSDGSTDFDTSCFDSEDKYSASTIFILMMKYCMWYTYVLYGENN